MLAPTINQIQGQKESTAVYIITILIIISNVDDGLCDCSQTTNVLKLSITYSTEYNLITSRIEAK